MRLIRTVTMVSMIMLICTNTSFCQTWDEWFRQKKTQKAYLIKQVAALRMYSGVLKEGYDIAKSGLRVIGDLRDGEFKLHKDYFGSLKLVSKAIKGSPIVSRAMQLEIRTSTLVSKTKKLVQSPWLSKDEVKHLDNVIRGIQSEQKDSRASMKSLLGDGYYEMSDEGRAKRLSEIHQEMSGQYEFAMSVYEDTRLLIIQRERENKEIQQSKLLLK